MSGHWIGFATLEGWRAAIDPSKPVFASFTSQAENTLHLTTTRLVILTAQPQPGDLVYYCQLEAGKYQLLTGETFGAAQRSIKHTAEQRWQRLLAWLQEQCLVVQFAQIARQANLRLADGQASFLLD